MNEKSDRRQDIRYEMDLITLVTAKSGEGETFTEKTLLRNMSSGGANFITHCAERYFQGQQLEIQVDLPGTADLKASLQGAATVSRIDPLPDSDTPQAARRHAVAVVISAPLQFVRKDAGKNTENPAGG